jgi:hypothetical protein
MTARREGCALVATVLAALLLFSACGDPELSDEAEETEGAGDPLAEEGSPLPGIPPQIPGLSLPL